MKKKKRSQRSEDAVVRRINEAINKYKDRIITRYIEHMGWETTEERKQDSLKMFENDVRHKLHYVETRRPNISKDRIGFAIRKTLRSEPYAGAAEVEKTKVATLLRFHGEMETFRKFNRHQKFIAENLKKVKCTKPGVNQEWEYTKYNGKVMIIREFYDGGEAWMEIHYR